MPFGLSSIERRRQLLLERVSEEQVALLAEEDEQLRPMDRPCNGGFLVGQGDRRLPHLRAHALLLLYLTRGRESAGLPTRTPGRNRSLLLLAAGATQKDSRAGLPLANGRWPHTCAQDRRPDADRASAPGAGTRAREARWLPVAASH